MDVEGSEPGTTGNEDGFWDGKVAKVEVHQNAQVPTGYLNVHMTDGSVDRVNVSDVNEAVKYLDEQGINCYIHDVPQESIFLNNVLPMLLMFFVVMVMMMVLMLMFCLFLCMMCLGKSLHLQIILSFHYLKDLFSG